MILADSRRLTCVRLHHFPSSPHCLKVRAVAHELDLALELVEVDLLAGAQRSDAFLAINPNGLVPVLEHEDLVLWESNAILGYLAALRPERGLVPTTPRGRAEVDRWLHWQSAHLGPSAVRLAFVGVMAPLLTGAAVDREATRLAIDELVVHCRVLDRALRDRAYLAGALSIADFALACILFSALSAGFSLAAFPAADAWLDRMLARDAISTVFADARRALSKIDIGPR